MELQNEWWTRKETAEYLRVKTDTLAVWASTKRYNLPYTKIGRSVLYKASDVIAFAESGRVGVVGGAD